MAFFRTASNSGELYQPFSEKFAGNIAAMDLFVVPTHWLRSALCLYHHSAEPQRPGVDQRHNKPDGRMDRSPVNGVPLG